MLFSEDTTPPRLSVAPRDSRPSRTSRTGLEHGLLKVKVCTTVQNQCNSQVRTLLIQLLLIQEALNFLFHQMFLRRLENNGLKIFQNLIAKLIKLFVMFKNHAKKLHQKLNQLLIWLLIHKELILQNLLQMPSL